MADPITREQVERAIEGARNRTHGPGDSFGTFFSTRLPGYVLDGWREAWKGAAMDPATYIAALTRWRDELAAAEPVLPTPAEDSPERLRERREALGWTTAYAGHWVAWFDHTDVERAECGRGVPAFVARYAAALSAEEARRATVGAWAAGGGVLHYSPPTEPERPAPRFKVGDLDPALHETALAATRMLHCGKWPLSLPRVGELPGFDAWNTGPLTSPDWIAQLEALLAEPAPPAPEVVDVPQPLVKRFGGVEASWGPGEDHVTLVEPARGVGLPAPLALLRAMLAAIDAQQGGAL